MNAVILAAGKGTRLKEITKDIPKPLLQVRGETILGHQLKLCAAAKIKNVFIPTHYLSEQIRAFAGDGSQFGLNITYSYEPELLGTAGALNNFREQLAGEDVLVLYGDNYFDLDLRALQKFHRAKNAFVTVGVHTRDDVSQSGMVEIDADNRVKRFIEKPAPPQRTSNLVSAGIYVLSSAALACIPAGYSDFGYDIIPKLIAEDQALFAFKIENELIAIDTPELYAAVTQKLHTDPPEVC
jgi:NDP-sugar pyrophosphorylase family protein